MTGRKERFGGSHVISGAFVFLLLGIFAIFSILLVTLGAQLYRMTVADTRVHGAARVADNYLLNSVRGYDAAGEVRVEDYDGTAALVLRLSADGEGYETRIYCANGMLCEQFAAQDDASMLPTARAFAPWNPSSRSWRTGF